MSRFYLSFGVILILVGLARGGEERNPEVDAYIVDNIRHFRILYDRGRRVGVDSTDSFIGDRMKSAKDAEEMTNDELETFVGHMIQKGRNSESLYRDSGFVDDGIVIGLLAVLLRSKNKDLVTRSIRTLVFECNPSNLQNTRDIFLPAINSLGSHGRRDADFARLVVILQPEKITTWWTNVEPLPRDVLIQMGDREAEAALLDEWKKAQDFEEILELLGEMGLAHTDATKKALLAKLSSEASVGSEVDEISIRLQIVGSLKYAFPNERLFTYDACALESLGDARFDKYRGIKSYTDDINEFARKTLGMTVWKTDDAVWFHRYSAVPHY